MGTRRVGSPPPSPKNKLFELIRATPAPPSVAQAALLAQKSPTCSDVSPEERPQLLPAPALCNGIINPIILQAWMLTAFNYVA